MRRVNEFRNGSVVHFSVSRVPPKTETCRQLAADTACQAGRSEPEPMQPFKPPFQGWLQLEMPPEASQGIQLMPWLHLAFQVQLQPIQLPLEVQ